MGNGLPTAPPLYGGSLVSEEEVDQALCLATPLLIETEEHFRMAHTLHVQRLAQETEVAAQLRCVPE